MPVLWAGLLVAACAEPPPALTGRKDASGSPTSADRHEARALRRFRFWRSLRWRLVAPNLDWLPGWPPLGSFVTAVSASVLAGCLPALSWPAAMGNSAATFVMVCTVCAALRRGAGSGVPCPGTRVTAIAELRHRPGLCAMTVVPGWLGGVPAGLTVVVFAPDSGQWAPAHPAVAVAAAATTGFCLAVAEHRPLLATHPPQPGDLPPRPRRQPDGRTRTAPRPAVRPAIDHQLASVPAP